MIKSVCRFVFGYNDTLNKLKKKTKQKHHNVGTVPKFYRNIVETEVKTDNLKHLDMTAHFSGFEHALSFFFTFNLVLIFQKRFNCLVDIFCLLFLIYSSGICERYMCIKVDFGTLLYVISYTAIKERKCTLGICSVVHLYLFNLVLLMSQSGL